MEAFAKEYDPVAPVANPYVDQNPFEVLQEGIDEDTDPNYVPKKSKKPNLEEKYDQEPDGSDQTTPTTKESESRIRWINRSLYFKFCSW